MPIIADLFLPILSKRYPPKINPVNDPAKYIDDSKVLRACRDPISQYRSKSTEKELWSRFHSMSAGPRIRFSLPPSSLVILQGNSCSNEALVLVKIRHFSDLHVQVFLGVGSIPEKIPLNNY